MVTVLKLAYLLNGIAKGINHKLVSNVEVQGLKFATSRGSIKIFKVLTFITHIF